MYRLGNSCSARCRQQYGTCSLVCMFEFPLLYALASMPLVPHFLEAIHASGTASNNIQYCCNNTVGSSVGLTRWLHVRLHIRNYVLRHKLYNIHICMFTYACRLSALIHSQQLLVGNGKFIIHVKANHGLDFRCLHPTSVYQVAAAYK